MIKLFTKKRKGFTLIELVVVIAILGILALIAIPRMAGFQDSAKGSGVVTEAKTIASTIAVLTANGKTFVESEETENNDTFTAGEVLGYAGIKTGGKLDLTIDDGGGVTSFTWHKQFGADYFSVKYTASTDSFDTPSKTTGATLTLTEVDDTY
jgi:type IV pilus assembly protein PilA